MEEYRFSMGKAMSGSYKKIAVRIMKEIYSEISRCVRGTSKKEWAIERRWVNINNLLYELKYHINDIEVSTQLKWFKLDGIHMLDIVSTRTDTLKTVYECIIRMNTQFNTAIIADIVRTYMGVVKAKINGFDSGIKWVSSVFTEDFDYNAYSKVISNGFSNASLKILMMVLKKLGVAVSSVRSIDTTDVEVVGGGMMRATAYIGKHDRYISFLVGSMIYTECNEFILESNIDREMYYYAGSNFKSWLSRTIASIQSTDDPDIEKNNCISEKIDDGIAEQKQEQRREQRREIGQGGQTKPNEQTQIKAAETKEIKRVNMPVKDLKVMVENLASSGLGSSIEIYNDGVWRISIAYSGATNIMVVSVQCFKKNKTESTIVHVNNWQVHPEKDIKLTKFVQDKILIVYDNFKDKVAIS